VYNLTPTQKELLRLIVKRVRAKEIPEEFTVSWGRDGVGKLHNGIYNVPHTILSPTVFPRVVAHLAPEFTKGAIDALATNQLLHVRAESGRVTVVGEVDEVRHCTVTGKAYEAVDSNFAAPDTSFVRHLTPLADITTLDSELKDRCLPILGAGAADRKLWDSAVRTAGVIFEERIRTVGGITDRRVIGRELVNQVFGKHGTFAAKFANEAERESHREIYAGVVGAFRNPSAHRLVDPTPPEGGAFIVFVNLLLKKLEDLRDDANGKVAAVGLP
jgi:uncharacterized protein (TIGR02391 family)